ncbi:MAG TPA: Rieske (2Fe-2S) protein [Candidatus Polarisedimenticolia bacterium]|nr:Rieske (2Fe-2S) protein [Candidatus Polarisedimenticolia bacterium]
MDRGAAYVALYTRVWDQDEATMRRRSYLLDARCASELLAYDALCPHAFVPLDEAPLVDGRVVCPWHRKVFDVRTGRGCGPDHRLRLSRAPRVELAGGRVRLARA